MMVNPCIRILMAMSRVGLLIVLSAMLGHVFAQLSSSRLKIVGVPDMEMVYTMLSGIYSRREDAFVATYSAVSNEEAVKEVVKRTADFAVVDTNLSGNELEQHGLLQFPTMTTAIVPVVNLPNVKSDQLHLTAAVLGDIMSGVIGNWQAKKIRELNPTLTLPNLEITRIVRPEMSGASQSFTVYLGRNSSEFGKKIGGGPNAKWPSDLRRASNGNEASDMLVSTPGAITYVEMGTGNRKKLDFVSLRSSNGNVVKANLGFLVNSASNVRRVGNGIESNTMAVADIGVTWPILLTSYVVMTQRSWDDQKARMTLRFFFWQFKEGDPVIQDWGLVPLPIALQSRVIGNFHKVQSQNGKQLFSNFDIQ